MRAALDVLFGIAGQELYFDAPEGRPSAVEGVTVHRWDAGDADDAELATSGAAAVEASPSTTTDAAAGPAQANARRVPLTSTVGCAVDRMYLLVGADGQRETLEVREVAAGDAVIAHAPLHNNYASGAAFVSTRITVALDDTWVADDANIDASSGPRPMYRVRWVYVVAGETKIADTYFNLTRYGARHSVQPQHVDNFRPGWLDSLPLDHKRDQGRRLIAEAAREVRLDLAQQELDDAAIADAEVLDSLVRYKTIELTEFARFLAQPQVGVERSDAAAKRYRSRFDALVRLTPKTPVRDTEGAAFTPAPLRLSKR